MERSRIIHELPLKRKVNISFARKAMRDMIRVYLVFSFWLVVSLVAAPVSAASLMGQGGSYTSRAPLFPVEPVSLPLVDPTLPQPNATHPNGARPSSSLFTSKGDGGLFAHLPTNLNHDPVAALQNRNSGMAISRKHVVGLRDFIARAEAGPAGYDAVVYSAKIRPRKKPTDMTLKEIFQWIEASPGQNHAIGRYQFIPSTLRALADRAGVPDHVRFSPKLQDHFADLLFEDAGIHAFLSGDLPRKRFMHNLAKIWAGLPGMHGKSLYHGIAGNKATVSWEQFDKTMARLFPGRA